MNYNYSKNKYCKCGKLITDKAKRCSLCANRFTGKFKVGNKNPAKRKSIRTKISTSKLGKLNPNFKGGKPKCIDCGKQISYYTVRCCSCNKKYFYSQHPEAKLTGRKNPMFGKIARHGKGDYYKNIYMRSSWEIIYAKWLDHCKVKWQYECKTFDLGNTTYTPDFYLPNRDRYIEIKGYWRQDAKKKFKIFKKQYPNIKISLIIKPEIQRIKEDLKING